MPKPTQQLYVAAALIAALICTITSPVALADRGVKFTVVHSFAGTDGQNPSSAALVRGPDRQLYGVSEIGGAAGFGTLFRIDRNDRFRLLHTFAGAPFGAQPSGLAFDDTGALIGTTTFGGASDCGTVWRLGARNVVTTVHEFDCIDGNQPLGPLALVDGILYGTTQSGGATGWGSLYQLTQSGELTPLHSFTNDVGEAGVTGLAAAPNGTLYGSTYGYSGDVHGTVFSATTTGTVITLHGFAGAATGSRPTAPAVTGADGALYGTTLLGGISPNGVTECGTIYRLDPATGQVTIVYTFQGAPDGCFPFGKLALGSNGHLYGTTTNGGEFDAGSIFEIAPNGVVRTIYSFTGGTDGGNVMSGLVETKPGIFYGTTGVGGKHDRGVIYRIRVRD